MSPPKLELDVVSDGDVPKSQYLEGRQLLVAFIGLLIAVLLITLDQTIVATALPRIVSTFNALSNVTWVVTAYYLTQGGCMLVIGQVLMLSRKKYIFLASITLFEIGSLICAVAESMPVLIFGRAVAGCGAAGYYVPLISITFFLIKTLSIYRIQISVATIIPDITPLEKRPMLFAMFGGVLGISTVAGPILGGAFTDHLTWRWCFWINLPCGAIAVLLVLVFLKTSPPSVPVDSLGGRSMWLRIDWIGAALVIGFFTSLLLPLQWGGNTKPWNSPTVIALFVVSGVLLVLFLAWERYKGKEAMIPLAITSNRTSLGCAISGFLGYFALMLATVPITWQHCDQLGPRHPAVPDLRDSCCGSRWRYRDRKQNKLQKTGRYWWFLLLAPSLTAIGSGLLYTLNANSPSARLTGYQILYGTGVGLVFQNVIVAVQAEYANDESLVPQATAFVSFCQILGGIVSISMAGSIFANELPRELQIYAPDLTSAMLSAILQSVSAIQLLPTAELQAQVIAAYAQSLDPVFVLGAPAAGLASFSAL
ncbi:MFS general substrate transporter [Lanmaoa asiatica]|nr:MFS general substrate transporter [Lanmaoa asiatica]